MRQLPAPDQEGNIGFMVQRAIHKVVKFLPSIMGKNWLHVRDGSGTRGKGDDDIAVISDDQATVGSVVTLTGTVRLDKDFGAGYQYPVIIDGAKLK